MARKHYAAALAASVLAFLLLIQVLTQGSLEYWQDRYDEFHGGESHKVEVKQAEGETTAAGTYLVGAGKADITG